MEASNSRYHDCSSFLQWFKEDLTSKPLVSVKMVMFFFYGATLVILHYNLVHMKSLGITVEEMSLLLSLLPLATCLAVPMSGALADKLGNFKVLLSVSILALGFTGLLFLAIPVGRVKVELGEFIDIYLVCEPNMTSSRVHHPLSNGVCKWNPTEITKTIENAQCGLLCPVQNKDPVLHDIGNHTYVVNSTFAFHSSPDIKLNCSGVSCEIERNKFLNQSSTFTAKFSTEFSSPSHYYDFFHPSQAELTRDGHNISYICQKEGECTTSCKVNLDRNLTCSNSDYMYDINPTQVFMIYLIVRTIQAIIVAVTVTLTEGAVLAIIVEHKGDLGLQRLWATFGCMIIAPSVGVLADRFLKNDFRPIYYSFFLMCIICMIVILNIDLQFKKPATKLGKEVRALALRPAILTFFFVMLIVGVLHGFIENYLFWYLQDMGASKSLFGLIIFVATGTGIPFLIFSGVLIEWFGHVNLLLVGFSAYVCRFIGYYFMTDPWYALGLEVFESLTNSLVYTIAFSYVAYHSTPSSLTTMESIMASLHWGVGRTGGSILGGILLRFITLKQCYLYLGIFTAVFTFLYAVFHHCYVKRYDSPLSQDDEEELFEKVPIIHSNVRD